MSINKKYFYLKFKETYFDQDHVRAIETMKNGYEYSLIIIKLYLKSLKWEGRLMVNERIPYSPDRIDMLAGVLGHDPANVMHAINLAKDLGVMDIQETGEMWMSDIQSFIGHSSTEAERKSEYRKRIENTQKMIPADKSGTMSQKVPPELESELEKDKDIESDQDKQHAQCPTVTTLDVWYKAVPIPLVGGGEWRIPEYVASQILCTYPHIDLEQELKRMALWSTANPTKRKTAKGMARFVTSWIERSQNSGRLSGQRQGKARDIVEVHERTMALLPDHIRNMEVGK